MFTAMTEERKPGTFELIDRAAQPTAVVPIETTPDGIGPALGQAFAEVQAALGRAGVAPVGPPFARYFEYSPARVSLEAGFPIGAPVSGVGRVMPGELPAGRIVQTWHAGGYDTVGGDLRSAGDLDPRAWTHTGRPAVGSLPDRPDEPARPLALDDRDPLADPLSPMVLSGSPPARAYHGLTAARRPAYHPPALAGRLAAADGKEPVQMWNDLFIRRVTPPTGAGVRGRSVPISS